MSVDYGMSGRVAHGNLAVSLYGKEVKIMLSAIPSGHYGTLVHIYALMISIASKGIVDAQG